MFGPKEQDEQTVAELERVRKALAACSVETLARLDWHMTTVGLLPGAEPTRGLVSYHVDEFIDTLWRPKDKGGRPKRVSYEFAVEVLSEQWEGDKKRGAKVNQTKQGDHYRFNSFVQWLGGHLRRLDPERLKTDNAACLAAWNALGDLENSRKKQLDYERKLDIAINKPKQLEKDDPEREMAELEARAALRLKKRFIGNRN